MGKKARNGQFGGRKWSILDPQIPKKYPPNLKNGHRGAKFPFSECQNYTDKSISQIPPGPPNRGSKPPGGVATPTPPLHPLLPEKPSNLGGVPRGGVKKGGRGGWGGPGEEATE